MLKSRALILLLTLLAALPAGAADYLDMTYPFDEETIYWPTARPFRHEEVFVGRTEAGYYYEAYNYSAAEHGGTHIDAPVHFAEGRWSVDEIPLEHLVGPAVVVDISEKAAHNPDAQLTPRDLAAWEAEHGRIPYGAILMVYTGWGKYWGDRRRYLGTDRPGDVENLHFPGIHPAAAEWLAVNRTIRGVGIDTPSVDYGPSRDFRTHRILYEHNLYGLENVANLDKLPVKGATVYAIPMKIRGGSGGPCRIFATGWR